VLPSGQKLTLGLLATIALKVVSFCEYAALLPFFKCTLEVMLYVGDQQRLQFCLDKKLSK
jgi:hypothetical protein